ncbi:DUF5916 domain-containing protein [Rubrivirga sp. IMCC45206]|uniref:DUF5916 domain-containing protein n=1 Tax=Rubrivirga sp. IMCC45206 TaxID=3391614 RepID=UPI00398FF2E2
MKSLLALLLAVSAAALPARSQTAPPSPSADRTLKAVSRTDAVRTDGQIDERAWEAAPVATGFTQFRPSPGDPAAYDTEVRVLVDTQALYVGLRMHDPRPDSLTAPLVRRDRRSADSDWAHVMIDGYDDNRTAFVFAVNPRGSMLDYKVVDDAREDVSWDAVWSVATRVDSAGWTAEFRIPLSQLRFGTDATEWGFNVKREVARIGEVSYWSPPPPDAPQVVSNFGALTGLRGLRSPRRLEVRPYVLGHVERAPLAEGDPFYQSNALSSSAGADLTYGLTGNLTLTATLNPDFGEVEADPAEVNLTAYESYFAERRPFFSEGSELFAFSLGELTLDGADELVYSRRIGRAPQYRPSGTYVSAPATTPILGALKLTGRTTDGWSVGAMSVVSDRAEARVATAEESWVETVEPLTSYTAVRLQRDLRGGQSALGVVGTSVYRSLPDGGALDALHRSALAGGLSGRHRFGGNTLELSGWALGSRVAGAPDALLRTQTRSARYLQRPDLATGCLGCLALDSTRTELGGVGASLGLRKISGGNWRWVVNGSVRSAGFEVNDLGFQRTADVASVAAGLTYFRVGGRGPFRYWSGSLTSWRNWTLGGEQTLAPVVLQGAAQLKNLWSGGVTMVRFAPARSVVELRGGPALYTPGRSLLSVGWNGDPRKEVRWALNVLGQREDRTAGTVLQANPTLSWRPSPRLDVSTGVTLMRARLDWLYLASFDAGAGPEYLGSAIDQTTASFRTRVDYSISPRLSLQAYLEPFVSAATMDEHRLVADPLARDGAERYTPIDVSQLGGVPLAFSSKQLNASATLRWEYRPGSVLHVVWRQGREAFLREQGVIDPVRDFGSLFGVGPDRVAPTNEFSVRLTYWFGQ